MRTSPGRLLVSFFLAVACQCSAAAPHAEGAEARFSLTISSEKPVVDQDDSIFLRAILTNTSGAELPFGYWGDVGRDLELEAVMADGQAAPESKSARKRNADPYRAGSWITGSVPVGETVRWRLNVDDFFEVTAPGTYTFRVSFPAKSAAPVLSNFVVVSVNPAPFGTVTVADVLKSAAALYPKPTTGPVSLDIDADRSFPAGQGITVRYELSSTSKQTIIFPPGTIHQFAVEVRDASGKLVADRDANRLQKERMAHNEGDAGSGPPGPAILLSGPGGIASGPIFPDRLVDLSKPGIYTIQLWKKLPAEAGGGEVRSNVIAIRIK